MSIMNVMMTVHCAGGSAGQLDYPASLLSARRGVSDDDNDAEASFTAGESWW
jgi:hypothetical protein